MEDIHLIREAEQIKLLLDKIAQMVEENNIENNSHNKLDQKIENITQVSDTMKNFLKIISSRKTNTNEFLTKIHHELRTPLVPILAYTEMILDSKYGSISDEQRTRLEIINSNTKELAQIICDLFNEKTLHVLSDNHEENKCSTNHD